MQLIHITPDSHIILDRWLQDNLDLQHRAASSNKHYFKNCVIEFTNPTRRCYCKTKNRLTTIEIKQDNIKIVKIFIYYTPNDTDDYELKYKTDFSNNQAIQELVTLAASDFLALDALFLYGNIIEHKQTQIRSRTEGKDKHYFIKSFDGKTYAVNSHSHCSPNGVFSVRGHFRKYKNGKVIWIESFLKGVDKDG